MIAIITGESRVVRSRLVPRALALIVAAAALLVLGVVLGANARTALAFEAKTPTQQAEYEKALVLGTKGYEYGLPLLDMNRIRETDTSVNVCNEITAYGPTNTFCHARKLIEPSDHAVLAPNRDTLYSTAWLDLSGEQPQVMHIPSTPAHYHVFELLDMWTTNFQNVGSAVSELYPEPTARPYALPDGDYIIAGPNQTVDPTDQKGLPVIRTDTSNAWIVGRTEVNNEADVPTVNKIQNTYTLTPLNKFKVGQTYKLTAPKVIDETVNNATIPGTLPGEDPLKFFDALGDLTLKYPPYAADQTLLTELAAVGIGVGKHPSATQTEAVKAGLHDAVKTAGPAAVTTEGKNLFAAGFAAHNGWLVANLGSYGTDYALRAFVDKIGVSALDGRVATYPLAQTDRMGSPLTGAKRYVAHFPPGTAPPPVQDFWSLTLYDRNQFLVENSAKRYLLNDRSNLHYNADGSLDIYIQPTAPTNEMQYENWLPSPPAGNPENPGQGFNLLMRLYGIAPGKFEGVQSGSEWKPPTLLPCNEETNKTATGVACAG